MMEPLLWQEHVKHKCCRASVRFHPNRFSILFQVQGFVAKLHVTNTVHIDKIENLLRYR